MGDAAICEPTFLKKFIELMTVHYGRISESASVIIAQLNPTTATDRSYWLKKWGLDILIDFNAPLCDVQGLEFEGFQSVDDIPVTDQQRAAIEYGLIRANIITNRADFAPSLNNINLALRWLGYQVQPQTSKLALIVDRFGRLSYGTPSQPECCDGTLDFPPCEETECVPVNPCEISFGVEDCCRCKLQLRLSPICETLMAAPAGPCQPQGDDVPATSTTIDICTDPQTVTVRHIGATTAANFLRRVMPVWAPYDLEIIQ